jgi:hypothetical protein
LDGAPERIADSKRDQITCARYRLDLAGNESSGLAFMRALWATGHAGNIIEQPD